LYILASAIDVSGMTDEIAFYTEFIRWICSGRYFREYFRRRLMLQFYRDTMHVSLYACLFHISSAACFFDDASS
jgi:hypothetical protein